MFYFDLCAVLILCVLLFSVFFRGMAGGGLQNRLFTALLALTLVVATLDLISITLPPSDGVLHILNYCSQFAYLALRNAMAPVYILYLISLTDTWFKLKKSVSFKVQLVVPYAVVVLMLIINIWNGSVL